MPTQFIPGREADLVAFVNNFGPRITTMGASIGILPAQATGFQTLATAFIAAWDLTKSRSTRNGANVILKNEKKVALVKNLRLLAKVIQAHPATTNEQRSLLGLTIRAVPQPRPAPATYPVVEKRSVVGNTVNLKLHGLNATGRARPVDCASALVFSYVGANPPANDKDWFLEGVTPKNNPSVTFAASLPAGTKVWVTAAWQSATGKSGPAAGAVGAVLGGAEVLPNVNVEGGDAPALSIAA